MAIHRYANGSLPLRFIDPSTAPSPALQSRDKGALRVNLEPVERSLRPELRPESRKVDIDFRRTLLYHFSNY